MSVESFRAQLASIRATADALIAQLDEGEQDEPADGEPVAIREPLPLGYVPDCKHRRTEPRGSFGVARDQKVCIDCRAVLGA